MTSSARSTTGHRPPTTTYGVAGASARGRKGFSAGSLATIEPGKREHLELLAEAARLGLAINQLRAGRMLVHGGVAVRDEHPVPADEHRRIGPAAVGGVFGDVFDLPFRGRHARQEVEFGRPYRMDWPGSTRVVSWMDSTFWKNSQTLPPLRLIAAEMRVRL